MPVDDGGTYRRYLNRNILPIGHNNPEEKELHTYESAERSLKIMTEEGLPQEQILETMNKIGKNIELTGKELLAKIAPKETEPNETNQIN